jgi:E1A/CREB-binding protein
MNAQAHISGQISGQVPNQAGSQLPVLPQHNGSALPPQMQNVPRAMSSMDPELLKARQYMQEKM